MMLLPLVVMVAALTSCPAGCSDCASRLITDWSKPSSVHGRLFCLPPFFWPSFFFLAFSPPFFCFLASVMLEHGVMNTLYTHVSVLTLIKDLVCQNQILYSHKKPPNFCDIVMKSSDTCFPSVRRGRSGKGLGGAVRSKSESLSYFPPA